MAEPRRVLVGNRELQLPKCITVAGNAVRLFYHFNSFRLYSEARENVPGDFSVSCKTGVTGSTGIFGLRGLTRTNVLRMSMVRDTLFPPERGTDEAMHPLVASRVLRIYERKNPIQSALLNTLLDRGHDKVFRIEQFDSKFCEKVQRRVEVVVAACTLKVSELRAFHQDRGRHLMALTLARPTIAGAGFNWNSSAISSGSGSGSGSGKEAAGGSGSGTPSNRGDFTRAGPNSTRTPDGESSGAGSNSERGLRSKEASRASKRKRSTSSFPSSANDSAGVPGGTPKRSATTTAADGRGPSGTGRCPDQTENYDNDDDDCGHQGDGGPLGFPPENEEAGGGERAGVTVKLSPEAEARRAKWLDAVDENDKRFQLVRERVGQEMIRAEDLHRARSLELFRWSVEEHRGKHAGLGCNGLPPMFRELERGASGGGCSFSSSSSSAAAPSSSKTSSEATAGVSPGALPDARARAKKYIEAVTENDARLLNRKDSLRAEQERAQEDHHARSLELFAWDVEERMGKHDALGSEGPRC